MRMALYFIKKTCSFSQDIGIAMQSRRKVMMAMVLQNDEYKKLYEKCRREMGNLELPVGL